MLIRFGVDDDITYIFNEDDLKQIKLLINLCKDYVNGFATDYEYFIIMKEPKTFELMTPLVQVFYYKSSKKYFTEEFPTEYKECFDFLNNPEQQFFNLWFEFLRKLEAFKKDWEDYIIKTLEQYYFTYWGGYPSRSGLLEFRNW